MAEDYDIGKAFQEIEEELIASMIHNLKHHRAMETEEGFEWSQWQVVQLQALEEYRKQNQQRFTPKFQEINDSIDGLISIARQQGGMEQEIRILNAIRKGYSPKRTKETVEAAGEFMRVNDKKLDSLITATKNDFTRAEFATLRMANDKYRKIIFNAQVYANAGGTTYQKAVDMATKDFLKAGINCIEYKNGARHSIRDYADMCIRTATKRAYLAGEGEKRKEWGISTVIINKRSAACPKCLPFCGVVLIDDVWSGGEPDGKHQLMSSAIEKGLYHPRCKDIHTTYFPGVSTMPEKLSRDEKEKVVNDYNDEQKQNYYQRQAEQQERIARYSLDPENQRIHKARSEDWKKKISENANDGQIMADRYAYKEALEIIGKSSRIKLQINLFDKQDSLYLDAFSVDEIPGFTDICMHGSSTSVQVTINGKIEYMNAKEFAKFLRKSTNYNGGNIRLASCATGYGDNSFAQQLSKELGVKVMAPDDDLYYAPDEGTMFVGSPYTNTGTWRIFNNGVEE